MLLWILTLLFCSQFLGRKAELDMLFLDFQISYYDPDYFKDCESSVWENNFYINITLTNYLPSDTEIRLQLLGATMGEYIVPTGIDTILPLVEACDEPIFVSNILSYFNTTSDNCPAKPGNYIADSRFDGSNQFPDDFPPNNYVLKTTMYTSEKPLLMLECYQRIS